MNVHETAGDQRFKRMGAIIVARDNAQQELERSLTLEGDSRLLARLRQQEKMLKELRSPVAWEW